MDLAGSDWKQQNNWPALLDQRYAMWKDHMCTCGKLGYSSRVPCCQWLFQCDSVCLLSKSIWHSTVGEKSAYEPQYSTSSLLRVWFKLSPVHHFIFNFVTVNTTTKAFYLQKRAHNSCLPWSFQGVVTRWSPSTSRSRTYSRSCLYALLLSIIK